MSRSSSISNLVVASEPHQTSREVFRWMVLRDIGQQIYSRKATSILGSFYGSPTTLSADSLICIGTDRGHVLVFDFRQQLKCVCGIDDACELTLILCLLV